MEYHTIVLGFKTLLLCFKVRLCVIVANFFRVPESKNYCTLKYFIGKINQKKGGINIYIDLVRQIFHCQKIIKYGFQKNTKHGSYHFL